MNNHFKLWFEGSLCLAIKAMMPISISFMTWQFQVTSKDVLNIVLLLLLLWKAQQRRKTTTTRKKCADDDDNLRNITNIIIAGGGSDSIIIKKQQQKNHNVSVGPLDPLGEKATIRHGDAPIVVMIISYLDGL